MGPAPEALNETVTYDADKAAASVSASVTFELQGSFDDDDDDDSSDKDDKKIRRRNHRRPKIEKRDVNKPCSRQPVAFGPSPDDSDTIEAWKALPDFAVSSQTSACLGSADTCPGTVSQGLHPKRVSARL